MARPGARPSLALVLTSVVLTSVVLSGVLFWPCAPALALPSFLTPWERSSAEPARAPRRSGPPRLQEVAPPGAVQQLKSQLDRHRPSLTLLSPDDDAVIRDDRVALVLNLTDWPTVQDPELAGGPSLVLQIDGREPLKLHDAVDGRFQIQIDDLEPGSHRFSAWAAYPWGEAVKKPGASLNWRLHLWQKLPGTQPDRQAPWLVPVSPRQWNVGEPLLLDWLIWNAPLQNLRDGDQRWKLRLSVNGDSVLVDQLEPLWLKGATSRDGLDVQMELLDGLGEPIAPEFNNRLLRVNSNRGDTPHLWLKPTLTPEEQARLSGDPPQPEPEPISEPEPELAMEAEAEPSVQPTQDTQVEPETQPERDVEPEPEADAEPERAPALEEEPRSAPEPDLKPQQLPPDAEPYSEDSGLDPEEANEKPQSSLGGSTPELDELN